MNETINVKTKSGYEAPIRDLRKQELVIPIVFHLMKGIVMRTQGVRMGVDISADDIYSKIIPEVNLIWKDSNIKFEVKDVLIDYSVPDSRLVKIIENADRETVGRGSAIMRLTYASGRNVAGFINAYIIPFLGHTSRGLATPLLNQGGKIPGSLTVGTYSTKYLDGDGNRIPRRIVLVEEIHSRGGSVAKVVAHEIGHCLGLMHPVHVPGIPDIPRLMGGPIHGYFLTLEEIETAREVARNMVAYL